jgi:hypothetical protein
MRTLAQCRAYFKKHDMRENYDYMYWVGQGTADRWGYGNKANQIGGGLCQASYCCGVMEFGSFYGHTKPEYKEHWKCLMEYLLQKSKLTYLRTETITYQKQNETLDEVFTELGFRLVTTIPSAHGKRNRQRYNIHVWEWLKK